MLSTIHSSASNVPEFTTYSDNAQKNSRKSICQQDIYPLKQSTSFYDSHFEIANRAFYATINKFTRHACQNKRNSYSFLQNWHLHNIYSKSQQTLLGIQFVKPVVLLSGDDFMFTPPFVQEEEQYENYYYENDDDEPLDDDEDEDWDSSSPPELYHLSRTTQSSNTNFIYFPQDTHEEDSTDLIEDQTLHKKNVFLAASYPSPTTPSTLFEAAFSSDKQFLSSNHETYWLDHPQHQYKRLNQSSPALPICIPSQLEQETMDIELKSPEEPELSPCSSYDEQFCPSSSSSSCGDSSIYTYMSSASNQLDLLEDDTLQYNSTHCKSLSDDTASVVSYQSLADLIHSESMKSHTPSASHYGSLNATQDMVIEIGECSQQCDEPSSTSSSLWTRLCIFLLYLWQMLIKFSEFCIGNTNQTRESPKACSERQSLLE